jgi:2-keto-4-pentenoate hydratase/2-oxohepta-3-ene-1,7-dioic acid hydratase in catechol pathway
MDKIVCVGKNYLEHAKEMARISGDKIPEKPVLFIKPPSILRSPVRSGEKLDLQIPPEAGELHHECEIVLRLNRDGYRMSLDAAADAIGEVSLGLDMTLRERQALLKQKGQPWETSKTFLDSAVVGPWIAVQDFGDYLDQEFLFTLEGEVKQRGKGKDMTFLPAQCVAYISEFFPLKAGDLIYTGTPGGVGPVSAGQTARLCWGDKLSYEVKWRHYES